MKTFFSGNKLRDRENVILLAILVFGILLRISSLHLPLLDSNSWRQTDTASIARNFYENDLNILYPQIDWRGATEGFVESEFPAYPYIVAVLYKIFGLHDWLGRLLSLFFFVLSSLLLFKLVQKICCSSTAFWAVLLFVVSPLNIHFSRAFMPASLLVFCAIASIYSFSEWIDRETWALFIVSAVSTSLAILIKPASLYLSLPLLFLAVKKFKIAAFYNWRLWLYAVLVLVPAVAWYYHAHQLFLKTSLTFGLWGEGYSKFGGPGYWLDLNFYRTIFSRIHKDILTLPGLLFAALGFFFGFKRKNDLFFWWGIGFAAYMFIVAEGHMTHFYYQLPLVPILCVYAGLGMNFIWKMNFLHLGICRNIALSKIILFLFVGIIAVMGYQSSKSFLRYDLQRLEFGKRIGQLAEENSLIIIGGWKRADQLRVKYAPKDPIDFYFSRRKGWELNLDDWNLSSVKALKNQGAEYFATYYPIGLEEKKDFAQDMENNYKLIEKTERWVIYSLE